MRRRGQRVRRVKRIGRRQRLILHYRRQIAKYEHRLDRTIKSVVRDMKGGEVMARHRVHARVARSRHAKRVLKKCTTRKQRHRISRKIRVLVREGYPVKQAAAIAYSMCRRARRRRR